MLNLALKTPFDAPAPTLADRIRLVAAPVPAGPDAAIFQAWADFKARRAIYLATPDEILIKTDGLEAQLEEQVNEAEERILALPAATLEGLAIKLRMRLTFEDITPAQFEAVLNGWLPTKGSLDDPGAQEALGVLLDVERMIKRPAPVAYARPMLTDPVYRQAWADFVAAERAYAAAPVENDEDEARVTVAREAAEAAFFEVPVTSLEAIALRLRWQLQDGLMSQSLSDVVCSGAPLSGDQFEAEGEERHEKLLALDLLQAVEAMIAQPATDTAIHQAWTNYLAAQAVYNSTPTVSDEDTDRECKALWEVEGRFLDIPVTDFAGAALRLRWLLGLNSLPETDKILMSGVPLTPDMFPDCGEREMVKLILDVERLAAGVPA